MNIAEAIRKYEVEIGAAIENILKKLEPGESAEFTIVLRVERPLEDEANEQEEI